MFQAFKELRTALGRTLLITGTVAMIAVLVSFLTALTGGLAHQSISELDRLAERTGGLSHTQLVLSDNGTTNLAASTLTEQQVRDLGGDALYTARTKVGSTPAMVVSNPEVPRGSALVSDKLAGENTVTLGSAQLNVTATMGDVWLDHQPIVEANPADISPVTGGPSAVLLPSETNFTAKDTQVLTGKDIYKVSASYTGENMSLSTMTYLLFVISALVVGAFFAVWTMQRLRGVAITAALGGARKVIVADALTQAIFLLLLGVTVGVAVTVGFSQVLGDAMPIIISPSTTIFPGLLIIAFGLVGAAFSLRPVLTIDPRSALSVA
ncbi:FtsX-like permease family protein [Corynebacterium epidermidicanis]|uniref:FtsX-like permease family n=1 Tax=Corynebacterium epidermidicanis TaxID=1050174 RepID=A0A0G3GS53_9CORY|nr:ABC transporter permease [Corynebacterium epidermidicanis]AKK03400.1 FtsX-like permease family [Corynebacterium epidermidicanis]